MKTNLFTKIVGYLIVGCIAALAVAGTIALIRIML